MNRIGLKVRRKIGLKKVKDNIKFHHIIHPNMNIDDIKKEKMKHIGKLGTCRTICSCPMCGSGRKWWGHITLDEEVDRKYTIKEEIENYYSELNNE